ncbi:hypothetical protein [Streptomyces swartbergensis]|uniref:Uncharacterized protein n=1 Tax=Streptomyces swartbergensis TaxID=487165 RepID=A0A243S2C0_9ACTN|nr:hypothetical protein [Streptomyces swartbergensis]OUD01444.1 hypothetical protein CA983_20250 [Streptomyces swartbergensis]
MTDTVARFPRRSALRLLGGAIAVVAAAAGGLAVPSRAQARDGHGPGAGARVMGRGAAAYHRARRAADPVFVFLGPKAHDWVPGTGPRTLWIGASSRDLGLRTSARVGG